MLSFGFASISYDDATARLSYIECLPMLAADLTYASFLSEIVTIARSVGCQDNLTHIETLLWVIPRCFSSMDTMSAYDVTYQVGSALLESREKVKARVLELAEGVLGGLSHGDFEYREVLRPLLARMDKFAVWRIARLTAITDDFSAYEDDIFRILSRGDVVVASEALAVLYPSLARRYLVNMLTCGNYRAFINAIERHGFTTEDPLIGTCLNNVTSHALLQRIAALPAKFLTMPLLLKLVGTSLFAKQAAVAAMNSRFFQEMVPKLIDGSAQGANSTPSISQSSHGISQSPTNSSVHSCAKDSCSSGRRQLRQ
jgi:hypothetical protein